MIRDAQTLYDQLIHPVVGTGKEILLTQLNDVLPVDVDPDDLDSVFQILDAAGIQVIDDEKINKKKVSKKKVSKGKFEDPSGGDQGQCDLPRNPLGLEVPSSSPSDPDPHTSTNSEGTEAEQEENLESTLQWYKERIWAVPRLTEAEEQVVGERAHAGDEKSRQTLIETNLRLVLHLARRYEKSGSLLMDLVQAGNEGLMEAVRRYNPKKHGRFASFAEWWIKRPIVRHIASNWSIMRVPEKLSKETNRVKNVKRKLKSKLARDPSVSEIAEETGLTREHVEYVISLTHAPMSFHAEVDGKEGIALEDTLPDENAPSPSMESVRQSVREMIDGAIKELDATHQRVLHLRYGLDDDVSRTVDEVAKLTGRDRSEVSRIESEALQLLRSSSHGRSLRRE